MKKPTDENRLGELIGKMEVATTDGDLSALTGDDIGDIYSWLMWAVDSYGNQTLAPKQAEEPHGQR
jgi:hypothetical protein